VASTLTEGGLTDTTGRGKRMSVDMQTSALPTSLLQFKIFVYYCSLTLEDSVSQDNRLQRDVSAKTPIK
jgi:hypothetical protein